MSMRVPVRHWIGLALGVALGALFIGAGIAKLIPTEFEVQGFAHFGYAPWFMVAIGVLELLGGLLLLLPRTSCYGAVLMVPVMIGAVASHLSAGDPAIIMVPALVVSVALVARVWLGGLPVGIGPFRIPARA